MSSDRPMTESARALGSAIAQARRGTGLASVAVAASAGLEPSAFEAIESGREEPSLEAIVRIAAALELSAAELFEHAGL